MAASRTCSRCELPFPFQAEYAHCPACGSETTIMLSTPVASDWEKQLKAHIAERATTGAEAERVIAYRISQFKEMGFDWDDAARMGALWRGPEKIDVWYVRGLVQKGAALEHALAIVT